MFSLWNVGNVPFLLALFSNNRIENLSIVTVGEFAKGKIAIVAVTSLLWKYRSWSSHCFSRPEVNLSYLSVAQITYF